MSFIHTVAFAAILILGRTKGCSENAVRLEGLESDRVGRVQVCEDREWRDVCSQEKDSNGGTVRGGWRDSNAVVVCRQLGYPHGVILTAADRLALGRTTTESNNEDGRSHMTRHVTCSGLESSLDECPMGTGQEVDCRESAPIVMCTNNPGVGSMRLIHVGSHPGSASEGVMEVYTGSEWVGVCTDQWSEEDSGVVCRQLGYQSGTPIFTKPHSTVIRQLPQQKLNYFHCMGDESSLLQCNHTTYTSQCHTATYASVNCSIKAPLTTDQDDTASVSSHLSVSLDVIMSFAAVQLVVLTLTILLQVTILVTWTKWRKRKAILSGIANSTQPARATEFPPPPPSYSESSSNSVLLESGRETNTPLPLPPADN